MSNKDEIKIYLTVLRMMFGFVVALEAKQPKKEVLLGAVSVASAELIRIECCFG